MAKQQSPSETGSQPSTSKPHTPNSDFPIVGMGASAGGLEAFKIFLRAMPPDSGMAFILVQHLDPTRESLMAGLLAGETRMPVVEVQQHSQVEPNHVYLIPPNAYLTVRNGVLYLRDPDEPRGRRRPIDVFYRSLAADQQEKAIVVTLSGTGTNGAAGLKDIKANGGLIMVQEPGTAQHDGMIRAAIATGLVDYILPVEKMPEVLLDYVRHPYLKPTDQPDSSTAVALDRYEPILALLRSRQDCDFRCYKKGTLLRRIQRRMSLNHVKHSADYLGYLRQHPAEVEALARDLMISVTHFFRDPQAWEQLEKAVLPRLAEQSHDDIPLRVWVPGCATGEESYTLAMLLLEQPLAQQNHSAVQLFASDLNREALAAARAGLYPDGIATDLTAERLRRFFHEEDHYYRINKEVRDLVTFAVQNLINDPPFGKLDLISCRNVLIYLEPEIQEKVVNLFHFALKPAGYLFLGNAETVGSQPDLFEVISKKWRIYQRIGPTRPDKLPFPALVPASPRTLVELRPAQPAVVAPSNRLAGIVQQLVLECYTRACALVNRNYEILYLFGPTDEYLMQPTGELTPDLLAWVREGLRAKLRAALHQATRSGETTTLSGLRLKHGKKSGLVNCTIEPLTTPREVEGLLLMAFEDQPPAAPSESSAARAGAADDSILSQMEYELKLARDELRSTIEQLESSNEEFKATNEEVMSINEELQSTNEELETSKEELQSLNEELITTNQQLESKNLELEATNDDLKNLLASTQIATLFLDRRFRIRRFTPVMTQLMRLIASDVGRSIEDITSKLGSDSLLQDAARVLEQLAPVETEIQADDGRWYLRRTLPYRTEDSRIDGVVITFIETTEHKLTEGRQRFLLEFYDTIRSLREPEAIMATTARLIGTHFNVDHCTYGVADDLQTQVTIDRDYYSDQTATRTDTSSLKDWGPALLKELRRDQSLVISDIQTDPRTVNAEQAAFAPGDARAVLIVPLVRADQILALLTLSHRQPRSWSAQEVALVKQIVDRSWLAVEKARSDQALRLSEERLRIALKGAPIMVFNQDQALRYTWVHNPAVFTSQPLLGKQDRDVWERPEDSEALEGLKRRVLETGQSQHRTVAVWSTGRQRWYDLTVEPLPNESGQAVGLMGAAIDITERMELETQLRRQAEWLAEADHHKNDFLAMLGHELRNPLAPIRNTINALRMQEQQGTLENATLHWGIDLIDRQVRQLTLLVNDLLDVARITQNRIVLRKQPAALATIIRQAEETIRPLIDERHQELTVSLPPETLVVEADPARLAQVVANLLHNAAKYTRKEGRIWLEAYREDHEAVIRVRDTGIGIPSELLPRIFDLFVQAEHGPDRAQGGLGLGLTLVHKLVEMHGGRVQAASAGPDQGSEFTVRLPLLTEKLPEEPGNAAPQETAKPLSRRILVVEDNQDVAGSLLMLLKAMGHTVEAVPNGEAALEVVQSFQPEVVLLDIGLPEMDGYQVARRLRALYPPQQMLLIALTGYGQDEDRQRAREAGFNRHILKPGSQEELEAALSAPLPSGQS